MQLYADGFDALPLTRQDARLAPLSGGASPGRDIYYDQRYAHNLEMRDVLEAIITHAAAASIADDARGDRALHEAVLDQHRAVQQPDRAQVRARRARPTAFAAAARAAAAAGAPFPPAPAARRSTAARATRADVLRSRRRSDRHEQDACRRARTFSTASANNLYAGVTMQDLDGFEERYPLNSRLVKQRRRDRRRGLPRRRPLRRADRGDRRAPRGGHPVSRPSRWRTRCAR